LTSREVATHSKPDDLWLIIDGDVYDVTKFREEHPGGSKVLSGVAGKDATKKFDKYHRRAILQQPKFEALRIGVI
ncbi:cytochrome b5, partial [Thozetella sp. PMI_491]